MSEKRVLPARSTRGKRVHKLMEKELKEDEELWNKLGKGESEDESYKADSDGADIFDPDFGESESDNEYKIKKKKCKKTKAVFKITRVDRLIS